MKYQELESLSINGKLHYLVDNYQNGYSQIASYILNFEGESRELTIKKIATNCYVSNSTVERFVKVIGYNKFSDFKYHLANEYQNHYLHQGKYTNEAYFFDLELSLKQTLELINIEQITMLTTAITHAKVIFLIGIGASSLVASDLSYKLERMGFVTKVINDSNLIHFDGIITSKDDLCIAVTNSGKTGIINECLYTCHQNESQTAIITAKANENMFQFVNYQIHIESSDQMIRSNSASARIVMLAINDVIHKQLLNSQNHEQFIKNIKKTRLREY